MFCKLKNVAIGSLVSTLLPLAALAADVNDNYSTAVVEKYVNDSSDQAVQLLDIMTCIAGRGGVSQPGFANKSWIGIVDETKCGIDPGDTSGGDKKATIEFTSSLAAAGGTQEVVGYMEQSDGSKVVMNIQIKQSVDSLPPYGEWYASFYFVGDPTKDFANQPSGVFHGMGKVEKVGNDVVVLSAHSQNSSDSPHLETKIIYEGADVDDVTFAYKQSGFSGGMAAYNGTNIGKASATELYTGFVNSGGFQSSMAQCKKRDAVWNSAWLGALYDTTTGARLKLATPPFQFTVDSDSSRGHARKSNSWMDNDTLRLGLDLAANTIAVTRDDTSANVTMQWTPTNMETKSFLTFSPATNDMFNSGEGVDGKAKWDGTDLLVDQNGNYPLGDGVYETSIDTKTRVWSSFYNSEFAYDGTTSPGTWKMINMTPFSSSNYPASGSAQYKCYGTYNCPHINGSDGNMNPTLAEYKSIIAGSSSWWNEFHGSRDGTHSGSTEFHYYLTAITPPTGYAGATLYWDDEKDGLDTDDKPVMFKFNIASMYDADNGWHTKAMEHGSSTAVFFTTDGNAPSGSNYLDSEQMWGTLIPATSSCTSSNWDTCSDAVEFTTRQYVYDQPLIPKDASGTPIDISPVMKMKYTQDLTNDLNYNGGVPIEIPATLSSGDWIEWLSKSCTPGMTGDLDTDGDDSTCQINIDLTAFNNKTFNIRYDGELNDLPGYYDRGQNTFYRLINPKDGQLFTNMADDKTYKFKALGIDEVFVPQTNAASCDAGVKFTAIPSGFEDADLPSYTDTTTYPRPTQTWNDKPAAPSCIFEDGVETNCD
jgi:hypothetical protein